MIKKIIAVTLVIVSANAMAQTVLKPINRQATFVSQKMVHAPLSQITIKGILTYGYVVQTSENHSVLIGNTTADKTVNAWQITAQQANMAQPAPSGMATFNGKKAPTSLVVNFGAFSVPIDNVPAKERGFSFMLAGEDYFYAIDSTQLVQAPPPGLGFFVPDAKKV